VKEKKVTNHRIQIRVNGDLYKLAVDSQVTLLELLREDLRLTGTKQGCDSGECGSCTVLLDGEPVNACLVLAVEADGKKVLTIEGVAEGATLHPLQEAFITHGAVQCGYCSPGMILTSIALLHENPSPSEWDVKKAIAGNLCRCGAYQKIVEAVLSVSRKNRGSGTV
jgi:carbon-monoxide dehydrogenase small subunit